VIKKKKDYTPFPPPQLPSKEDLLMEAGEYFTSQSKKRQRAEQDRAEAQVQKVEARKAQRQAAFQPPEVSSARLASLREPHACGRPRHGVHGICPAQLADHTQLHMSRSFPASMCHGQCPKVGVFACLLRAAVSSMSLSAACQSPVGLPASVQLLHRLTGWLPASQEARQSVSQATTDAGADDLKALAAKLKKKHRSGAAAQQQQSNGGHGDAAAFLAGNGRAAVPNGIIDQDGSGEEPQKERKKEKASQHGASPEKKGKRKQDDVGAEAALAIARHGKEEKVEKKRKLKTGNKAAPAQGGELQQADAEQSTANLQRTKKKKAKRTSVTDIN